MNLYRAFHNIFRDYYKHLKQENQRTYLNGIFHGHRKTEKVFSFLQLEMFDVCTTGDTAHIDMILNFFIFPVAVKNSIKVGPLVFLL
jgi:hypothetical protein